MSSSPLSKLPERFQAPVKAALRALTAPADLSEESVLLQTEPAVGGADGLKSRMHRPMAMGALVVLIFVVIRPIMRGLGAGNATAGAGAGYAGAGALPSGSGGSMASAPRTALSFDDKVSVARQLADKNPERVAQIVRSWMQTDE